ncbi:hypothetical protein GCM10011576_36150 [Micromonospora parathelypteridis]|nr:hypothetical protein GCM10011576_36150 [Micromonospora parathelypteridis]
MIRNAACTNRADAARANSTNSASPRATVNPPPCHTVKDGRERQKVEPRHNNLSPRSRVFFSAPPPMGARGERHVDEGYPPVEYRLSGVTAGGGAAHRLWAAGRGATLDRSRRRRTVARRITP